MRDLAEKIEDVLSDGATQVALKRNGTAFLKNTESPIERLLAFAIIANGEWSSRVVILDDEDVCIEMMKLALERSFSIRAASQVHIGSYRVDFLLSIARQNGEPPLHVAVECDGHDFHERTKEQAARDKKRDRDLMAMGVQVMRFTGSQIWEDAGECARSVFYFLENERTASCERHDAAMVKQYGSMEAYVEAMALEIRAKQREAA